MKTCISASHCISTGKQQECRLLETVRGQGGLTSELEHFGGQVLHDSSDIDSRLGTDPNVVCILAPKESGVYELDCP